MRKMPKKTKDKIVVLQSSGCNVSPDEVSKAGVQVMRAVEPFLFLCPLFLFHLTSHQLSISHSPLVLKKT